MKKILLIQTGGTISMQFGKGGTSYIDKNKSSSALDQELPELNQLAQIETLSLFTEDSSNIDFNHWIILAKTIEEHYNTYDGFVILHGTDTMAYTASALSFALHNLGKPIILTGSQVPLVNLRSDARRNLINAIEVATLPIYEVAICFNDTLFRGNRSSKMSIGDFDAFSSPNFPPLAEIGIQIKTNLTIELPVNPFWVNPKFDHRISVLKLFPGLMATQLISMTDSIKPKGIVLEAFGSGNMPIKGENSILPFLEYCKKEHIIVLIRSQAAYDAVDLTKYENGKASLQYGVVSARDMTTEAAVTKLMYLIATCDNYTEITSKLTESQAGEIS